MASEESTLLKFLNEILENWETLASLAANVLILINRKKIPKWENDFRHRKILTDFKQGVKELDKHTRRVKNTVTANGFVPAADPSIDFNRKEHRDFVLEAWGALKQNVFNACAVNRITVSQSTGILDAVGQLRTANIIGPDIALLIKVLFNLGEKIANTKFLIPPESDARSYIRSVSFIVDWIKTNILTPPPPPPIDTTDTEPPPRQTVVGQYYAQPQPGHPTAWLAGIEGREKGRRFPVDKDHYRIGSNPDNDLCISGDDYVSGHHAYLNYQQGSLFLFDAGSRNGTFINEQQVTDTPNVVREGDRIRLGESIFEVSKAPGSPGRSKSRAENGGENQSDVRDPTWVP